MTIKRIVLFSFVVLLSTAHLATQEKINKKSAKAKKSKTPSKIVSFKDDVVPIIKTYCMSCHAEEKMSPSELDMDTYEQIMKGGKHGVVIVPGKADSSFIIQKISQTPPFGDPMPMKRKTPFPEDTLKILKTWINQGAKDN